MTIFGARAACCAAGLAALLLSPASSAAPAAEILRWEPPFSYSSPATRQPYAAPAKARRAWKLCVVVPHLKDAYWLAVNYGMIDEARRLGVSMQVLEAVGYPNLARQRSLVQACAEAADMDAVILGTVSFDGLSDLLREVSRRKPVLATVNDIADAGLAAKVGVSWYDMGRQVGEYLAGLPAAGQARVPVAWFPGPRDAGWVPFVDKGFRDAIRGSRIAIVSTGWGDTDKTVQRDLVQEALDAHPEVRYLVGNAMMAEAAVGVLRERDSDGRPGGRSGCIGVLSTYFTPGVYRGIVRGKILAAPTDAPVRQGRLSVDQAVELLEGRRVVRHMGPVIRLVDRRSLPHIDLDESMPPPTFTPQFRYPPR